MHDTHGEVDRSNLDDPSSFYGLDHSYRNVPKLREVQLDERPRRAAPDEPSDERGRPIIALPDPNADCDEELAGKSPEQMAEILARREIEVEGSASTDQMMREYPGKQAGMPHSSSGAKSPTKPKPPMDHTKGSIRDIKDVGDNRPHQLGGRVSTQALLGINRYMARDTNPGTILDAIGRTLYAGVSWAKIDFVLSELRSNAQRLGDRQAG